MSLSPHLDLPSTYTVGAQSSVQGVIQLSYAECESCLVVFMTHHFSCSCRVRVSGLFVKVFENIDVGEHDHSDLLKLTYSKQPFKQIHSHRPIVNAGIKSG